VSGLGSPSAAQQQAISNAIAQAIQQSGSNGSYSGYGNDIYNALSGSGQFDPSQLSALDSGWLSGLQGQGGDLSNVGGGNTNAFQSGGVSALDAALAPALTQSADQQIISSGFTPSTTTPAAQAAAAGYNPLQPAYLSQPATLNATTVNPQYLSSGLTSSLGAGNTINALTAANQPTFNQQDQQIMQALATAGLSPSSTAGQTALNNLSQQQLAGMDPSIAAAIQNSQANQLGAGEYNATTGNTAAQNNANALNLAAGTNLANQNNQQLYNANAYNTAGNNYFNAETGAYNNNANAFNALNTAGLSGAQNLAGTQASAGTQLATGEQSQFPVYTNPFSSVGGSAIGSAGSYPSPSSTTTNYYTTPGYDTTGGGTNYDTAVNGDNELGY
jgi:hypothetical protein